MRNQTMLAFLGGAILGGVVALLLAPNSGEETRRKIKDFVDDEKARIKEALDEAKEDFEEGREEIRERIRKKI